MHSDINVNISILKLIYWYTIEKEDGDKEPNESVMEKDSSIEWQMSTKCHSVLVQICC